MSKQLQNYVYDSSKPLFKEPYYSIFQAFSVSDQRSVLLCFLSRKTDDPNQQSMRSKQFNFLVNQIELIKQVKHRNVAEIYTIIKKAQDQFIFTSQYCEYGSIIEYLRKQKFFDQRFSIYIMHQVIQGLNALHTAGVVHGYINMENIEVDSQGCFKITLKCLILKAFYLSPQFKLDRTRDKAGDVFSLGTVFYKMMYGVFPYTGKTNEQMLNNIKKSQKRTTTILNPLLPFQICISKEVEDLIFKMMSYNKGERPLLQAVAKQLATTLIEDDQKLKRFPKQVEDQYFIFNYKQKIQHDKYFKELIFTCIKKSEKELRKLKVITINKQNDQSNLIFKYIGRLHFYQQKTSKLNKSYVKNSFLQVKQHFLTNNSLIIIHQYFNQTYLQEYVSKRSKNLPLKEKDIKQITFYTTQAIKLYNQQIQPYIWLSSKNIYIKQGLLKVGLPCLQFSNISKMLHSSKDTIDFLSPEKKNQQKYNQSADLWSLGILNYKLIFGAFPKLNSQNRIDFPQTPDITYQTKQFLIKALSKNPEQRGTLYNIQLQKPQIQSICAYYQIDIEEAIRMISVKPIETQELEGPVKVQSTQQIQQQQDLQQLTKIEKFFHRKITRSWLCKKKYFQIINQKSNKPARLIIKSLFAIALYIFLYYLLYIQIAATLILNRTNYQPYTIPVYLQLSDTQIYHNYTLITNNQNYFQSTKFTFNTIRDSMQCSRDLYFDPIDGGNLQYIHSFINSLAFVSFVVLGFFTMVFSMCCKMLQLWKIDMARVISSLSIDPVETNQFIRYLFINMALSCLTGFHYLLYGSLYHMSLYPCITVPLLPSFRYIFAGDFNYYLLYLLGVFIAYIVILILCLKSKKFKLTKWNMGFLLVLYLIGVGFRGFGGFIYYLNSYNVWVSLLGIVPQILELVVITITQMIDVVFWCGVKYKKINKKHKIKEFQLYMTNHQLNTQDSDFQQPEFL